MVYAIGKAGRIAYKAIWTVAEEIDSVLAELIASISSWTGKDRAGCEGEASAQRIG
jgi:hypothetical protein